MQLEELTWHAEACSAVDSYAVASGILSRTLPLTILSDMTIQRRIQPRKTMNVPFPTLLVNFVKLSDTPKTVFFTKLAAP